MQLPKSGTILYHHADASALTIDLPQSYRYMQIGKSGPDEELKKMIDDALASQLEVCRPNAIYSYFPLSFEEDVSSGKCKHYLIDVGFSRICSDSLYKHIKDCSGVFLFAATIGVGSDRLAKRDRLKNRALPMIHQGLGAMLVEVYCDLLEQYISESYGGDGVSFATRYSPGYGDFSLSHQIDVFRFFGKAARDIGLSLNDSLLMQPTKSVTALIGVKDGSAPASELHK